MTGRPGVVAVGASMLALSLAGCGGHSPAGSGGGDASRRALYQARAEAGDAEAQFRLGDSWCCVVRGAGGSARDAAFNNETATEWLCRSAQQDYGPAEFELARIYSGRPYRYNVEMSHAPRVAGAPANMAVALMWADLAKKNDVSGASDLRDAIAAEATVKDKDEKTRLEAAWEAAPCFWRDVIGG